MIISTSTQLILLFIFALALNLWKLGTMLLIMFALVLLLVYLKNGYFYQLMKRLKWFYLVMFVIFAFNTPGEHIIHWPFSFSPTYEGLEMGLIQVLRISLVLAVLSIILTQNTKQQLISGLYFLMKPLSYIGLDTKRFSARLWLTLYYVELRQTNSNSIAMPNNLADSLSQLFRGDEGDDFVITLEKPTLTWVDYSAVLGMLFVLVIALLG
jgi:energy-coupling factor transporter transmembrane protein EcfT